MKTVLIIIMSICFGAILAHIFNLINFHGYYAGFWDGSLMIMFLNALLSLTE